MGGSLFYEEILNGKTAKWSYVSDGVAHCSPNAPFGQLTAASLCVCLAIYYCTKGLLSRGFLLFEDILDIFFWSNILPFPTMIWNTAKKLGKRLIYYIYSNSNSEDRASGRKVRRQTQTLFRLFTLLWVDSKSWVMVKLCNQVCDCSGLGTRNIILQYCSHLCFPRNFGTQAEKTDCKQMMPKMMPKIGNDWVLYLTIWFLHKIYTFIHYALKNKHVFVSKFRFRLLLN